MQARGQREAVLKSEPMAEGSLIPVSRLLRYECPEDRALMSERGRGHHCAACDKTVVDMGRLTLVEAVKARRAAGAGSCSSYLLREGRLVFRAARRAGGCVVISVAAFLEACQSEAPPHEAAKAALEAAPSAAAVPRPAAGPVPTLAAAPLTPPKASATAVNPTLSASGCKITKLPDGSASTKVSRGHRPDSVTMGYF
jgi:hypothetical protein